MGKIWAYLKRREGAQDLKKITKVLNDHLKELRRRQNDIPPDVYDALQSLLEGCIDLYRALSLLFKKKHYKACLALSRAVMENSVNTQYILQKDTEQRSKNYILHSITPYLKRLKRAEKEDPGHWDELIRGIELYQQPIQRSGPESGRWDGKSFKQMCDELNYGYLYDEWYTRLSQFIHPQYKNSWEFDEDRPFNNFLKKLILQDMVVLSLEALKAINNKYNLLEGGVLLNDYPKKGLLFVFSISSKRVDEESSKK